MITYYDTISNDYDSMYEIIQKQKFTHCKQLIQPIDWAIDLGGGTGLLSEWIEIPLINVDISFQMLLQGIQSKRYFLALCCDIEHLPIRKNSITSLFSFSVFQNIRHKAKALQRVTSIMDYQYNLVLITILNKENFVSEFKSTLDNQKIQYQLIQNLVEDSAFYFQIPLSSSSGS
ncbi:MAG: class I SAM-dependent methyltransferase [Candidatus Heimdallarchaeota archaeon]|nr:class I SAM-dependent methyltransferase [Candidatus Heimdallarchaeota archaeon]